MTIGPNRLPHAPRRHEEPRPTKPMRQMCPLCRTLCKLGDDLCSRHTSSLLRFGHPMEAEDRARERLDRRGALKAHTARHRAAIGRPL